MGLDEWQKRYIIALPFPIAPEIMKNTNSPGLFDEQYLLEKLTKLKDPLVKLNQHIDWNIFRPILDVVFNKSENSNNTGRPPYDRVLMFKILVLQSLYSLADDAVEY